MANVAVYLVWPKTEGAVDLLLKLVDDPDASVRTAAVNSLGAHDEDHRVLPTLRKLANDDDYHIREPAKQWLVRWPRGGGG